MCGVIGQTIASCFLRAGQHIVVCDLKELDATKGNSTHQLFGFGEIDSCFVPVPLE